jgi:tRNA pseudouridine32 synthase/23S rRNA pseudouridine746 synthase
MLAVPGKDDVPSVFDVIRDKYPDIKGPIIVHRLDMDTSGIMVLAKNEQSYKELQRQFIAHEVEKHYVALLDATNINTVEKVGKIILPLCLNPDDRPRQIVSEKYGKYAETNYVLGDYTPEGYLRVDFYPATGRTHQLRVHAAHKLGLNAPIVGDNLYGKSAERLYLHAQDIKFVHPLTGETVTFTSVCPY